MADIGKKKALIIGALMAVLVAGVTIFYIASDNTGGSNSDSNLVMFIILTSQIPIWISVSVARNEERKGKDKRKSKDETFYDEYDAAALDDIVTSASDGELVDYDSYQSEQQPRQ